jgi:RNA polymerase sigma factor (sigma-70 family)
MTPEETSWIEQIELAGNPIVGSGHRRAMEPSDADLWTRSRAGDRAAFGALFERHANAIGNYCLRRIGSWATAEDMLSIVFLEAWRRREKELPAEKVLPWLYGIATNVVRNQRRSERRHAVALTRIPRVEPEPDFARKVAERLDDERQVQEALALLGRLPKREQDVYVLCGVERLGYEDAALALDLPIGTVRSRLSRARARLRELDPGSGHEPAKSTDLQEAGQP